MWRMAVRMACVARVYGLFLFALGVPKVRRTPTS